MNEGGGVDATSKIIELFHIWVVFLNFTTKKSKYVIFKIKSWLYIYEKKLLDVFNLSFRDKLRLLPNTPLYRTGQSKTQKYLRSTWGYPIVL